MAVDEHSGEVDVLLAENRYTLKLTLGAIRKMELATDQGWQPLINHALNGELTIGEIAGVIWAGMIGSGCKDPPSYEEVCELIFAEGLIRTQPIARDLLLLQAVGSERWEKVEKSLELEREEEGTEKGMTTGG